MTDKELDNAGLDYFKKTYPSYMGCDKFTKDIVDAFKAGYNAALGGYDPFKEYFEKDGEEEIIDEDFSV